MAIITLCVLPTLALLPWAGVARPLPLARPAARRALQPPQLSAATPPLAELLSSADGDSQQKLCFVGGKGGVGKTTTSSALAVRLADSGLNTLIVSTDPAHSLSDALMQDVSGGVPVEVNGCPTLMAMEVQTDEAVARFRAAVGGFRASDLGLGGVAEEVLSKLGLDEFADILDNTPPGLDELLALAETLAVVRGGQDAAAAAADGADRAGALGRERFDRVVFDTAPTGHTLRLLAFPDFLDNLLTKLVALKARVGGAIALLGGLLGGVDPAAKLDEAVVKLERWRSRVAELQRLLTDPDVTDFVVVGIPSRLSVAECARLLAALAEQGVAVNHLVVNQIVDGSATGAYVSRLAQEQQRALAAVDGGASPLAALSLSRVPFFSMEMRGVFPLKYYASQAYGDGGPHAEAWRDLLDGDGGGGGGDRFVLVGGKGGVGKTTSSAALAVEFAERGHNTLVVSTDPAHSLGDALDIDLSSGEVARIEGVAGASLYAIEVKVDEAVAEFKRLVGGLAADDDGSADGGGGLGLADFADVFDVVPPGVDELVALAKVVALARADSYGVHFDRVVVDTAPTGHTLRLLTFPEFLDNFIERLLVLRTRFQGVSSVMGGASSLLGNIFNSGGAAGAAAGAAAAAAGFGVGGGQTSSGEQEEPQAIAALTKFQAQMRDLQALLKDGATSEFVIVSIPTYLSLTESERLQAALGEQGIAVRRGVLNRLIPADGEAAYVEQLAKGQRVCLDELRELAERADVSVTEVGYFDVEVRAVYGLRAMGAALFSPSDERDREAEATA